MSVKVFVVIEGKADLIQIGGNWWDIDDAAGDINGGDFWSELEKKFPEGGVVLKEIRIIPEEPAPLQWEED